jgi:hypothetical protein
MARPAAATGCPFPGGCSGLKVPDAEACSKHTCLFPFCRSLTVRGATSAGEAFRACSKHRCNRKYCHMPVKPGTNWQKNNYRACPEHGYKPKAAAAAAEPEPELRGPRVHCEDEDTRKEEEKKMFRLQIGQVVYKSVNPVALLVLHVSSAAPFGRGV